MKVVEKGKDWSMTWKCGGEGILDDGCGKTLELDKNDICVKRYYDRDFHSEEYDYYFRCSECGQVNKISEGYIPEVIKVYAQYKKRK